MIFAKSFKYRAITLIMFCIFLSGTLSAQDTTGKKVKEISISLKVIDENGKAFPKAQLVIGEGIIHAETDENGTFSFKGFPDDFVSVSAYGYEKSVTLVEDLMSENTVKLVGSKVQMTVDDEVPLPFTSVKKRNLTGAPIVLGTSQLEKYPSTDIRNALTGLAAGVETMEYNGQPGMSAEEKSGRFGFTEKVGVYNRGNSMMYIIDDIPADITEMPLDPNEIETITVVKDIVGKAMFGPAAANGVVFIKTKRGKKNERILNVNIEAGVAAIDRMPGWVNGADYATLNNQARTNDGLLPRYTENDIAEYAKNNPYDLYHPSINFKEMMLKNSMSFKRVNVSSSGGNDRVQYFAYLGYDGDGDIPKIGPTADYNRLNARSNIDIKINDFIKVKFDFFGGLSYRRSANYGYNSNFTNQNASTNTALSGLEFNSLINDITYIPPIAFPVYATPYDPKSGIPPYFGVSNSFGTNPIGNLTSNGYYTESGRTGNADVAVDFDMKNILDGLKSKSFLGLNTFNQLRIGKAEQYYGYVATPSLTTDGQSTIVLSKKFDGTDMTDEVLLNDYYYQRMVMFESLNYEKSFGKNAVQAAMTYYLSKVARNETEEPQRTQNGILTGTYSYDNKYIINGVLNYAGSSSFDTGKRYDLFPSLGFAWVISEENFFKSVKCIDYLKLRTEMGSIGYESGYSPFRYRDNWSFNNNGTLFGPASANRWFGNTNETVVYRTTPNRTGNPELTWEKRKEFSAGLDGLLFKQKLSLGLTYYNNLREGIVSYVSSNMPNIAGVSGALPLFNFNAIRYTGLEIDIQYTDKAGQFKYSLGGNATVQNSKYEKYDEPAYRTEYQHRTGKATDTYFGQTYIGKFQSDAETLIVPQIYDQVLHAGDLKYKDMNGDGIIDDTDQSPIGHSSPRLYYAVNLKLNYKGFELYALGTGRAFYDIGLTNQYYWNGWGDNTYSKFVKDNIGGAYPRLTFNKVNNNFVGSSFWLTKGGFFKVQNVELAYNLPANSLKIIGAKGARLFIRGANLLTISKIKDVDPESINSGVEYYPLFRTFTCGIKLTF